MSDRSSSHGRPAPDGGAKHFEVLESRRLLSAAQDVTGLTALRNDPAYDAVDGSGVGVAVIDTGAFAAHPDLRDNFLAYFDAVRNRFTSSNVITDPAAAQDPDGHGTHVAGTAVSSNPEIGVAPAAGLVAVRGLPSQGDRVPQFDTVDNSLRWVLEHYDEYNIRVVNMSLGDYTTNFNAVPGGSRPAIFEELEQVGVSLIVASGNNYGNFASLGSASPGVYGTFSVANTWPDTGPTADFPAFGGNGTRINFVAGENDAAPDRLAATSQRSTLPNQVAAPGQEILSTWNDPSKLYNRLSGTSMAAPFVSGVVALMQDAAFTFGGRYLTTGEVQSLVRGSADAITDAEVSSNFRVPVEFDGDGNVFRTGPDQNLPETGQNFLRVNAYRAVQAVRALVTGSPVPDPDPDPDPGPPPTGDANHTTANAVVVPPLDATRQFGFTGNVGADGEVQVGSNDVDLFRVDLESPGVVTFATAPLAGGTTFDAYLRLFDANGNPLAAADDSAAGVYPMLRSVRLPAGRYYFGVSSFNNTAYNVTNGSGAANGQSTGDYALTVGLTNPDPNGVAQGATHVDLTDPDTINPDTNLPANFFTGVIDSDPDPVNAGQRISIGATDVDMFQVVAPDDGVLTVDIDALDSAYPVSGVDSFVRVFDASFTQVAFNDDTTGGTDSFLQLNVDRGETYYVAVTTFGNRNFNPLDPFDRVSTTGAVGTYDVYFYFSNGDTNGTVFSAQPGTLGRRTAGVIGDGGGESLVGANFGDKDVDFYLFTTTTGLFDVTATATDDLFEPVLTLWRFNPDTADIERVRDTAGADARIIVPVGDGEELYVSVTGVGNNDANWYAPASGSGGDTGPYELLADIRPASALPTLVNDSVQNGTPEPVNLGDALYRNLGADGGLERGAADVDLYRFTASTAGPVVIRATAPGEEPTDPVLRLFDEAGNEVAFNDDASENTRDAILRLNVSAGQVFYIGVNGSSAAARNYNPITGAGATGATQGDYVLSVLPDTGDNPQPVERSITFGGRERAVYTDADGDVITFSLKGPGTGTLFFDAAAGEQADARRLVLNDTIGATTLSIKGATAVGDVIVNGPLKGFGGRTLDLRGSLTVGGSLPKLQLAGASGGTISLGPGAPVSIAADRFSDVSINAAGPIKSLKLTDWLDTDAAPDTITTPSLASLSTRGDFAAGMNVGSLGKASVGGALVGSDIRAAGSIASITAGSVRDSRIFAGVRPDVAGLPASAGDFANGSAQIKALSVKGRSPAALVNTHIAAPNVGKVTLGGVTTANNGAPFGIAAGRLDSLRATTPAGPLTLSRLDDPAESILAEDFHVRVV